MLCSLLHESAIDLKIEDAITSRVSGGGGRQVAPKQRDMGYPWAMTSEGQTAAGMARWESEVWDAARP